MTRQVLVVDDDPIQRRLLDAQISRIGMRPIHCDGGRAALDILTGPRARDVAVVVLDLVMPDKSGSEVMAEMRRRRIDIPVVVQTAKESVETVVAAMRAGAFDFVVKPVSPDRLRTALTNAVKMLDIRPGPMQIPASFRKANLPEPMASVVASAAKAAKSSIPVLVYGETGVGKEWIARAIQTWGPRAGKPFVTVNCGALPADLVESILFGHAKGAFTDAGRDHVGKFREADGGTLFLDEVGELSASAQVKLLRALQEGLVDPIGADAPVKVDVRVLSATNQSLADAVRDGRFREDLYYRLNAFELTVPPLRQRRAEIRSLCEQFLARFVEAEPQSPARRFSAATLDLLEGFDWPGNIRQLENMVRRAVVLADRDILQPDDFRALLVAGEAQAAAAAGPVPDGQGGALAFGTREANAAERGNRVPVDPAGQAGPAAANRILHDGRGELRTLDAIEADVIRIAIDQYQGRMSEIARRLGIGRSTLYRKMREYEITGP
ncbi:sigma-54 dependent transcriptional regulator [Fulvimarina sp. 2208YS6-2-32]|uniref:DNA-binding transcriptional regulator NtrC n=1 Tax=Fulvimarina uroteuthidis TaxID=3098149 RepID=A0ABU5HZW9_9HYPH|nr:sigma-54 dependent transcriptional regulator [Fulvimarina sp. 2208YS6-2-32]MDY8108605.1 sigma-54 dependent transcriptional regulator [Fulvimarina sp. 2208YS6-2-32]